MKKLTVFIILFSVFLSMTSNILAQPITFAPDDIELEQNTARKRGEADERFFDKSMGLYRDEEYDKSIAYCLKALAINPDDYMANTIIGVSYAKKGDFKKAVVYYQKATNVYPKQMALISMTTGFSPDDEEYRKNFYKAIEDYKNEIAKNPNNYQSYNDLGYLSFVLKVDPKFTDYYKKSIAIKPDYAQAHYNLALYYLFHKDNKLSLEECKILGKLDKKLEKVILRTLELAEKNKSDNP